MIHTWHLSWFWRMSRCLPGENGKRLFMVNGTAYAKALWDTQKDTYPEFGWSLRHTYGNQSQRQQGLDHKGPPKLCCGVDPLSWRRESPCKFNKDVPGVGWTACISLSGSNEEHVWDRRRLGLHSLGGSYCQNPSAKVSGMKKQIQEAGDRIPIQWDSASGTDYSMGDTRDNAVERLRVVMPFTEWRKAGHPGYMLNTWSSLVWGRSRLPPPPCPEMRCQSHRQRGPRSHLHTPWQSGSHPLLLSLHFENKWKNRLLRMPDLCSCVRRLFFLFCICVYVKQQEESRETQGVSPKVNQFAVECAVEFVCKPTRAKRA